MVHRWIWLPEVPSLCHSQTEMFRRCLLKLCRGRRMQIHTDSHPLIFKIVHILLAVGELELEFCLDSDGYFHGRKPAISSFVRLWLLTS